MTIDSLGRVTWTTDTANRASTGDDRRHLQRRPGDAADPSSSTSSPTPRPPRSSCRPARSKPSHRPDFTVLVQAADNVGVTSWGSPPRSSASRARPPSGHARSRHVRQERHGPR